MAFVLILRYNVMCKLLLFYSPIFHHIKAGMDDMRKKRCIAMLLAGGQGSRLGLLTKVVAKPAVPFGGK